MIFTFNSQFAYKHTTYSFTFNHQLSFDSHYTSFDTLLIFRSNNYHNYHNYVSTHLSIHSYHLSIHGYLSTHQLCFDIVIFRHTDYVSVNTTIFRSTHYLSVNTTIFRSTHYLSVNRNRNPNHTISNHVLCFHQESVCESVWVNAYRCCNVQTDHDNRTTMINSLSDWLECNRLTLVRFPNPKPFIH